jgi:ATP-binding protein involved in chromosome partitioning
VRYGEAGRIRRVRCVLPRRWVAIWATSCVGSGKEGVGKSTIAMFRKVNIPLLGMVENMSFFICPDTQKRYDIFGTGGAKRTAKELDIPFLGEVPLQIPIREHGDAGQTAANYDDPAARPYLEAICERLVGHLAATAAASPPLPSLPVL